MLWKVKDRQLKWLEAIGDIPVLIMATNSLHFTKIQISLD